MIRENAAVFACQERTMPSRTLVARLLPVIALLSLAALACNLQVGAEPTPAAATAVGVERPIVEIVAPAEGATFRRGQTVSVHARAVSSSGITLVELLVNGIRVASQPPAEGASPVAVDVVLDYKPEQVGTVALAVRAYSSAIVGQPATRTITVLPDTGITTPQTTYLPPSATPYNALCRARVNVNLNFRGGPSVNYGILATLVAGAEAQIVAYADQPDGRWWQVMSGGQWGWIKSDYTTQLGDCSAIRPGSVPPSPSPVPSATPLPTQPGVTATPTLPDLRLSLLEGPRQVQLGADGTAVAVYLVQVQNGGGQPSAQFRLAVLKPDGSIAYFDVPGMNPGQAFQVPSGGLSVTFYTPGLNRILVTVDDDNRVAESNEGNNQAYLDVSVSPGPATYTPPPAPTHTPFPTSTPQPTAAPPDNGGDTGGNQVSEVATFDQHGGAITALAFSPDGLTLASSSRDGTVRLWSAAAQQELLTLSGHTDRVLDVAFHPSGTLVASASWDHTVRLWDTSTGAQVLTLDHGAPASFVAFSPDGARVASGGENPEAQGGLLGLVRIFDVNTGTAIAAIQTYGLITGLDFFNAGTVAVATAGQNCQQGGGGVELFEAATGQSSLQLVGDTGWITALVVDSANGAIYASGQEALCAGNPVIWQWTGGALQATLTGAEGAITGLDFGAWGAELAASADSGRVWIWSLTLGGVMQTVETRGSATAVAMTPDGSLIATGDSNGEIRVWRLG